MRGIEAEHFESARETAPIGALNQKIPAATFCHDQFFRVSLAVGAEPERPARRPTH